MKHLIWIICLMGFATTTRADDLRGFDIDYPALFVAHADKVMQAEPSRRVLELPGPVVVTESYGNGQLIYRGVDHSGNGALGCSFETLLGVVAWALTCPEALTKSEHVKLQQSLWSMAKVVGENTYPSVPPAEVLPRLRALLAERQKQQTAVLCPAPDSGVADIVTFAHNLAAPAGQAALRRAIEQPRLPVNSPCL